MNGIDLEVSKGQIVGLGGLVGAGRTELLRAIIGADPRSSGRVTITSNGKKRVITGYLSAIKAGVAYVPEERRTDGLALTMTVAENIFLPNRKEISPTGVMPKGKIAAFAKELSEKIVIAKWLGRKPSFIVLDEPTRGVDVGAKAEIHKLVKELADNGAAVLVISSDLPELLELSDLIHVVRDGKIAGTLAGAEATEKSVMSLAAGEKLVGA